MDRKTLTHERILEAASRTLRREGFRGVTVAAAMKDAGLTHGGFYAHFPSQDALLGETLRRAGADGYQTLARAVEDYRVHGGVSRFRALVEVYLSERHALETETGCVVSALCTEIPRQSQSVQTVAREQLGVLVAGVAEALGDSKSAETVASAMVGALTMARVLPRGMAAGLLASVRSDLLERFDRSAAG